MFAESAFKRAIGPMNALTKNEPQSNMNCGLAAILLCVHVPLERLMSNYALLFVPMGIACWQL